MLAHPCTFCDTFACCCCGCCWGMLLVSGVDRGEMLVDRGEMLVAIVLDKPLAEAQALVDTLMPLCLKLRKSFISMRILLSHKHSLMCVMICPFRMCPCSIRKPKQSYRNDEWSAASNTIPVSPAYALGEGWDPSLAPVGKGYCLGRRG